MATKIYLKTTTLATAVLLSFCSYAQPHPAEYTRKLQTASLLFVENKGQLTDTKGNAHPEVLFTARSEGAALFLTASGIHYQFIKTERTKRSGLQKFGAGKSNKNALELQAPVKKSIHQFSLELEGANLQPEVVKEQRSAYTENFYLAQCPAGITGVAAFEKIIYKNVYPAIDWVIYSKGGFLEYDFLVHPGGDPSHIRLKVKDAESVNITNNGELLITTSLGEVREKAPVSYVEGTEVSSAFVHHADGTIGFTVKTQPGRELRIDPSVVWATYYGGTGYETGYSCAVDGSGNVYLAGETESAGFIASAGYQNTFGGNLDVFLVKFSSTGARLWATYYGGTGSDEGGYCSVDATGNVYLSGYTESSGIASAGFQNTYAGGGDAFLVKFTAAGSRTWATYYGGANFDYGGFCSVNSGGDICFAGYTNSPTGIASGGFQNSYGGGDNDAFLVRFNSTGSRIWATYYGGSGDDNAGHCILDATGNTYLVGATGSASGISAGGFQNTFGGGGGDGFLAKFSSTGSRTWATYYGGGDLDAAFICSLDGSGNIYVSGATYSASGIASGGFQSTFGGDYDAYLAKFNSNGSRLWSTYYGGSGEDAGYSCAVDATDNVYLAGLTSSASGIASGGVQNTLAGNNDIYVAKFQSTGGRIWGTYYGGSGFDEGYHCAVDGNNLYVTGFTNSSTGIASGGFQNTIRAEGDGFLLKVEGSAGMLPVTLTSIGAYQKGDKIQVDWTVKGEQGIKVYEVEKSLNGTTFSKAGEINANHSSVYSWLDQYVKAGTNLYRLRIVSLDGDIKYSQTVRVTTGKEKPGFHLYPNPANGNGIYLSFINQSAGIYTIRVLNTLSQLVLTQQMSHGEGSSTEKIAFNTNLQKGAYTLEIIGPGKEKQALQFVY